MCAYFRVWWSNPEDGTQNNAPKRCGTAQKFYIKIFKLDNGYRSAPNSYVKNGARYDSDTQPGVRKNMLRQVK